MFTPNHHFHYCNILCKMIFVFCSIEFKVCKTYTLWSNLSLNYDMVYYNSKTTFLLLFHLHYFWRLLTNVVYILNQTLVSHSLASYYHIFQWELPKWLQIICGSVVFYETKEIIFNHNVHKKDSKGLKENVIK